MSLKFHSIWKRKAFDLAVDLGTSNIIVASSEGIQVNEPCVIALQEDQGGHKKIFSIGRHAASMEGKEPSGVTVLRPLSQGVISEFSMTTNLLKALIKRAYTKQKTWFRPSLLLTLPKDVTPVEEKAFREAGFSAGAREVKLLPEPVAAAIGVGIDIFNPNGEMIIDVGGGITEISLFCLGDIVFNQSIRTGGDDLNETIKQFVRKKYNFEIGNSTAEKLKQALSFSGNFNELDSLRIKGINRVSGFPSTLDIKKGEVIEVLKPRLELISQSVIQALENAPEELSADLVKSGINLVGGGALTHGLKALIEKSTGLPVKLFNAPLLAVAKREVSILQSKFLSTELRPLY